MSLLDSSIGKNDGNGRAGMKYAEMCFSCYTPKRQNMKDIGSWLFMCICVICCTLGKFYGIDI